MRRLASAILVVMLLSFLGGAVDAPARAAEHLTLLSQARSVTAESRSDLDRTGNNPDLYCTLDEYSETDAPDFEPFEAYAGVSPVQFECHTLIEVYAQAYQNSRLSSTSFEFEGYVAMESYGYVFRDMGGHVLASSSAAVVFQLTEDQDYELKGTLSSGAVGRSSLRIVDKSDDTTLVSRVAVDGTEDFDLAGRLSAGTYEFSLETEGECGLDCSARNVYQATMQFRKGVPVPTTSVGALKARY